MEEKAGGMRYHRKRELTFSSAEVIVRRKGRRERRILEERRNCILWGKGFKRKWGGDVGSFDDL